MALILDRRRLDHPGEAHDQPGSAGLTIIGSYPPRACGIATFTRDLRESLRGTWPGPIPVVALDRDPASDPQRYPAEVIARVGPGLAGMREVTDRLDRTGVGVVSLQHEFGLFGGTAGDDVLDIVDAVERPVVTTFHTVPIEPDTHQRRIIRSLARLSERMVVMSERGRRLLIDRYGAPAASVSVIHHGVPEVPFAPTTAAKSALGFTGDLVILSYGLISPNKGLELAIRALAEVLPRVPAARLVVAGATHPEVVRQHGEAYRSSLRQLAQSLGVAHRLTFIDRYLSDRDVETCLLAADVFVTPYGDPAQVTSGTLAYALASGRAVVSTPYEHALELLADGRGRLVPFADPHAMAASIVDLLLDGAERARMRRAAWEHGRQMVWPAVGRRYAGILGSVLAAPRTRMI